MISTTTYLTLLEANKVMSELNQDGPQIRRLFIGNVSSTLAENPLDLTSRLERFGTIKSSFDLHYNKVREVGFGYLDIEISDRDFIKLKSSLHGVKFKGSKLVIDIAKRDYTKRWEEDHDNVALAQEKEAQYLARKWEFYKKIQNINMTLKDHQEVIKGRERKAPRKSSKGMTLRVNFNGTLKTVKCWKTKLWGYEKNKKLRDLVYKFQNGVWKDGNDHIVERVSSVKLQQGRNTLIVEKIHKSQRNDEELLKTFGDEEEEKEEFEKNNKVLANILGNFNFDKELDYKEEVDEFGDSDYEYQGALNSDDEDKDAYKEKAVDLSKIEYVKEGEFGKKPGNTDTFDDDDADDEAVLYDQYTIRQNDVDKMVVEDASDEDTEFLPTFGRTPSEPPASNVKLVEGTVSNTESLRTLFNSTEEPSFKLIEDEDDIDENAQTIATDVELPEFQIASIVSRAKNRKSLFFPHYDSPFLVAQTQISKLSTNVDFEGWDETFWEKRSEWTQEIKRRRRDVQRQMRKKNAKSSRVFV